MDVGGELTLRLVAQEDSYVARARDYVAELHGVAQHCKAAARDYGFTDDEIAAAFGKGG